MRSPRLGLFGMVLGTIVAAGTTVDAQEILIDDFEDGDDIGWTHKSGGPETFEVVDGWYRITNPNPAAVGGSGTLNIASLELAHDPSFSNGYFRARLRAESRGTIMGMVLRGDGNLDGPSQGYAFYFATSIEAVGIETWWRGPYKHFGEVFLPGIEPGEDWFMEAGAVGSEVSLKVWRVGDAEPMDPQIKVEDSTFAAGNLLLVNAAFGHTEPFVVDGLWDDVTFSPGIPAEAFAEATPAAGIAPLPVRLSAESTPACEDVRYQWTLPDGTTLEGADVDHIFTEPGRHVVRLNLRSENGCRASSSITVTVHPAPGALDPWQASVIGEPEFGISGQATRDESGTSIELWAGGERLSGSGDDNGFVQRELDCDGVLVARIDDIENAMPFAQVGLQMRESLEAGARHASLVLESRTVGSRLLFLHRDVVSQTTDRGSDTPAVVTPVWLKLERRRDIVSGSWSSDGVAWIDAGSVQLPGLAPTILAGFVALANEPPSSETSFSLLRARLTGVDLRCDESSAFRRGDANADGAVDLSDVMATFGHLFLGSAAPACPDAADADDSGALDLSDGIYTLGYLFLGSTAPPLPGPDACGPDGAADELGACGYAACP